MVAQVCNLSIQDAEVVKSLWLSGQPGLQSDLQDSQTANDTQTNPVLKKPKNI